MYMPGGKLGVSDDHGGGSVGAAVKRVHLQSGHAFERDLLLAGGQAKHHDEGILLDGEIGAASEAPAAALDP